MLRKIIRKTNIIAAGAAFIAVCYYSWLTAEISKEISPENTDTQNDNTYPYATLLGMINNTCSTVPFRPTNKLTDIVIRDINLGGMSYEIHPDLSASRDRQYKQTFNYLNMLNSEAQRILDKIYFTSEQFERFNAYTTRLRFLFAAHSTYKRVLEDKLGNCAEFSFYTIYKLLKLSMEMGVNIPIQKVENGIGTGDSNGHDFLMIDTHLPDINIEKKPNALKKYMRKSKELQQMVIFVMSGMQVYLWPS